VEYKLKSISKNGIPAAISKAELYRNLNEPGEAESICRDILAIEPDNQIALRLLGLAITDQFAGGLLDRYGEAEKIFQSLLDPYERLYYTGLAHERRAKRLLRAGRNPAMLRQVLEEGMRCFEEAEKIRPEGNDDALLRWNRCVRLIQSQLGIEQPAEEVESLEASDSPPI